jgi:exopolyphosphatase
LDSVTSSISYAYLASHLPSLSPSTLRYVPLIQTYRADLKLRPENIAALTASSVALSSLLTLDDLPSDLSSLSYVLVDHNKLGELYGGKDNSERVVGVLDHHVDEGLYETTKLRLIRVVGSCSSLITTHFISVFLKTTDSEEARRIWTTEVADLLLSAILIDTSLKPLAQGGKATEADFTAVQFLIPFSSYQNSLNARVELEAMNSKLQETKNDVGGMSGRDLLRRDYKEYPFIGTASSTKKEKYGLATVPLSFTEWLKKDEEEKGWTTILEQAKEWMVEKDLIFLGILTTFKIPKHKDDAGDKVKKSHGRELMIIIREDAVTLLPLLEKIKGAVELELVEKARGEGWRVWDQNNPKATRKQVAPAVAAILAEMF